ncbi:MAG: response regulator, partial [Nannocystaceae bacterium]
MSRQLLLRSLKRLDFAFDEVSEPTAALAMLATNEYDVVLIDHQMPGISGLELIRRAQIRGLPAHTKIIMVSANEEPELAKRAVKLGVDALLCKPVSSAKLCRVITELVRSAGAAATAGLPVSTMLLNHPDLAVIVFALDPQLTLKSLSDGAKNLLGGSPQTLSELLDSHDENAIRTREGKLTQAYVSIPELKIRHADGHRIRLRASAAYLGEDCAMSLFDLTIALESRKELEQTRRRHELVLEGTRLGLWDWNP